jgi:hypothetical protein
MSSRNVVMGNRRARLYQRPPVIAHFTLTHN